MSSSIQDAVLALVAAAPSHGYGIMRRLQECSLDPQSVARTSVYTALSRLEAEDLVAVQHPAPDAGARERQRFTYAATEKGHQQAAEWARTEPDSYDELRVRIAVAKPEDLEAVLGFVRAAEEENLERLAEHSGPLFEDLDANLAPWGVVCGSILGTLGAAELMGRAQWLKTARMALESLRAHPDRTAL